MNIQTKVKALGEHVFAHEKCDTQHFSQHKQRHLKWHHEKLYNPLHGNIIEGVYIYIEFMG
jgi:hypothetical protein